MNRSEFSKSMLSIAGLLSAPLGWTQSYPNRPIQFYVPVAAGGFSDTLGRLSSQRVSDSIGVPVVVVNQPSGGGILAATQVAKAAPNGYTLMLAIPGTHVMNIGLRERLPYDPVKDFEPVALLAITPNVLVANPSVPFDTIESFIGYARQNPGKLFFASTGVGSTTHLAMELLKVRAGIDITHVPYASSPLSLTALARGEVQVMFDNLTFQLPHIKAGTTKALAVTTKARSSLMPTLPTIGESAIPGFTAETWFGVVAPANTPKIIVDRLSMEFQNAVKSDEIKNRLLGIQLGDGTPQQFATFLEQEREKWVPLIRRLGIKVD